VSVKIPITTVRGGLRGPADDRVAQYGFLDGKDFSPILAKIPDDEEYVLTATTFGGR
jgi:hypothetical protein